MKKIAMAMEKFDSYAGGAESYAVSLADTLINNSWEVHLYGQQWNGQPSGAIFHKINVPKVLPASLKIFIFALMHKRMVKKEHVDIILGFGNTIYMNVYQSHGGVHWLSTERKLHVIDTPLLRTVKKLLTRFSLKHWIRDWIESAPFRMDPRPKIVAISKMVQDDIASYYQVDKGEIEVVYNGVDIKQLSPDIRNKLRGALRRHYRIPDINIVYLFVSYDLKKKGIEPLVDAAKLLKKSGKDNFNIIVVGGQPDRFLSKKVSMLGLENTIFFSGPTTNITEFYANADVFVLPTYYDACSLVLLEAMASGLPVITTEYNGAAGIITDGENGYIIKHPPRPVELAEKMGSLLSSEKLQEMSLAASIAIKEHSIINNHRHMMRIFNEVIGR
jgi:UDP-glucose:(heptosyl)LPS alpha-1,3-glucosyltransferase